MTGPADATLDPGGQKGPKLVQYFPALCSCATFLTPDFGLPSLPLNPKDHPKLSQNPIHTYPILSQAKRMTSKKAIK